MAKITQLTAGHYRIPLDVALTDSTHGTMTAFELVTVRVRDADGAEGVGYTYTTGHNGAAISSILARELPEVVSEADADLTEHLWTKVWWALHYGGRGGARRSGRAALRIARPGLTTKDGRAAVRELS